MLWGQVLAAENTQLRLRLGVDKILELADIVPNLSLKDTG